MKAGSADGLLATFGGGCFWCLEACFQRVKGVTKVVSGYAGGQVQNPTYKQVCSGTTGHAEVTQVTFKESEVTYEGLLKAFFSMHDPTTLNRQGYDEGTQYRSVIFYHSPEQKEQAEKFIKALTESKVFPNKIVTELAPMGTFYPAEDYHQDYYNSNPGDRYCVGVVNPKLKKFMEHYYK